MVKDITLGQYYYGDSIIHRLDPRTKFICSIIFIIELFAFSTVQNYILMFMIILFLAFLSKIPLLKLLKGIKAMWFIIAITTILNLFVRDGNIVFSVWKIQITDTGIYRAIFMAVRLSFLVLFSSLLTLTTTANDLTLAIEKLMRPLLKFKVPVYEIALMTSICLRFIPVLLDEATKIMKAQISRGAMFDSGNVVNRLKSIGAIFLPLFVAAFRRSNELAIAMEARCYRVGKDRTKMNPLRYSSKDIVMYLAMLMLFIFMITLNYNG